MNAQPHATINPDQHHPGCYNRPRPALDATHIVQDGWEDHDDGHGNVCRVPKWKKTRAVFGPERIGCQSDRPAVGDPGCAGCCHEHTPRIEPGS